MSNIIIYFLFILSSITITVRAQSIHFNDLNNLPSPRSASTSANDGENIYIANGSNNVLQFTSTIFKYNIATDSWSTLTNSSISKRFTSSVIINDKLYIFNGESSGFPSYNNKLEIIDLNSGQITFGSENPYPTINAGVAVWEDKIYSFGGSVANNGFSNKILEYDPATNIWKQIALMPFAKESNGEIIDGMLYIIGGYRPQGSRVINIYDIENNRWAPTILAFTTPLSSHSTCVVGTKIYIVGDYNDLSQIVYFETTDLSVHVVDHNMIERRDCTTESIGDQLFVLGGEHWTSNIPAAISSVQVTDLSTSTVDLVLSFKPNLFPNPTNEYLNFDTKYEKIVISDLNGSKITEYVTSNLRIDVQNLKNGVYLFSGKNKNEWTHVKWIKN